MRTRRKTLARRTTFGNKDFRIVGNTLTLQDPITDFESWRQDPHAGATDLHANPVVRALVRKTGMMYSRDDPYFTRARDQPGIEQMWAWESQRCSWRLAVAAVEVEKSSH